MFLEISRSEKFKDIRIVFIISDKLPFKQIEINYTLIHHLHKVVITFQSCRLFVTSGTIAHQDPRDFPGKILEWYCHFLLQNTYMDISKKKMDKSVTIMGFPDGSAG